MADAKALGNALSYNPFLSGDQNAKMYQLQQQQALSQALLGHGLSPLDTNNRSIGGVGYNISPLEGVAKLAQALIGATGERDAASQYNKIYNPQPTEQQTQDGNQIALAGAPSNGQAGPTTNAAQMGGAYSQNLANQSGGGNSFGLPPALVPLAASMHAAGEDRAVAELITKFSGPTEQQKNFPDPDSFKAWQNTQINPGATAYNQALGTNAAQQAPAGTLPPGIGGGNINAPQVNASSLQPPPGIQLDGQNPSVATPGVPASVSSMPSPLPGESTAQFNARLKSAETGASAQAQEIGKATGEAIKGAATADSRFDNAQALIKSAKSSANDATYGLFPEIKEAWHNQRDDKTSIANADFKNSMSQLLTQALPAIVQASGGRIDIPLLSAIKEAENADISLSPHAKQRVLDKLSTALEQQRQNLHNQVGNLTGNNPTVSPNYMTPQQIQTNYPNAKQAGDGNYYVPDPNRQGKFLLVRP